MTFFNMFDDTQQLSIWPYPLLIKARAANDNSRGVVTVLYGEYIEASDHTDGSIAYRVEKCSTLSVCMESPDMTEAQRDVHPRDRGQVMYVGLQFEHFDIYATSNDSRVLVEKDMGKVWAGENSQVMRNQGWCVLDHAICDLENLYTTLAHLLPFIGVHPHDVDFIAKDVIAKLQHQIETKYN